MKKKLGKFDRAFDGWKRYANRGPAYRHGQPDIAYANGWYHGYAAAKRDAKKARRK